jgi:hypothetical protein
MTLSTPIILVLCHQFHIPQSSFSFFIDRFQTSSGYSVKPFIMIKAYLVWPLLAGIAIAAPRPSRTSLIVSRNIQARGDKSGSAAAVWNNGVELLTKVDVAGKNYSVVLDTGSADM